jgi:hypothetical protein
MYTRSVGLHDAPYAKVLSHLGFLTISTHNDEGNRVNQQSTHSGSIFLMAAKPNIRPRLPQHLPALHLPR